ncbi:MAG: OsmC family peroxiredoxin [Solirubrobacterales bacterium]|nr:OsmC family peroxiredoxin [Solirubrobacterales bacterium]
MWKGHLAESAGNLTVGTDRWTADYSFSPRFSGLLTDAEGADSATNPEELPAAAHGACFSMALSLVLSEPGHWPTSIETTARVYFRKLDGAPTIAGIGLEAAATAPGIRRDEFDLNGRGDESGLHPHPGSRRGRGD